MSPYHQAKARGAFESPTFFMKAIYEPHNFDVHPTTINDETNVHYLNIILNYDLGIRTYIRANLDS